MSKRRPKVSVIVLNWNGIRYTLPCIESLKKQSYKDFEIILVDNGSTKDNSVEVLKKIKGIKLILNPENLGFAGGNNAGVKASSAMKYIAMLNNDAVVPKNWLAEMVAAMDRNPELGEAMSKVHNKYAGKEYRFDFYGTSTLLLFGVAYDFPVSERTYVPIFSATGGALIYRKNLLDTPFDQDYFIYHEDSYLGWLLRLKGYKVGVVPKAIVYHEGEATIKNVRGMSNFFTYLGERNRIMNIFLFYSPLTLLRLLPLLALTALFTNIYDVKRLPLRFKSYFWLLLHFPKIMSKRFRIQSQRKVPDSRITPFLSAKLFEESHFRSGKVKLVVRILNKLSIAYCRILGVKSVEVNRKEAGF